MNDQAVTRPASPRVERRRPPVEIFEDDQALLVSADVPGVAPGHVDVSLDRRRVDAHGACRARRAQRRRPHGHRVRAPLHPARAGALRRRTDQATLRTASSSCACRRPTRARRRQIPVTVN